MRYILHQVSAREEASSVRPSRGEEGTVHQQNQESGRQGWGQQLGSLRAPGIQRVSIITADECGRGRTSKRRGGPRRGEALVVRGAGSGPRGEGFGVWSNSNRNTPGRVQPGTDVMHACVAGVTRADACATEGVQGTQS